MFFYDPLEYYKLLETTPQESDELFKAKYRQKVKFWHPDHNPDPNAVEIFQKLTVAYDVLKDKKMRTIYNLLSTTYAQADFPDMKNLKAYKSATGNETPFLRVFQLYEVKNFKGVTKNLIGTFQDAVRFIQTTTRNNWLWGWLKPSLFKQNVIGLLKNYQNINQNAADNYKLLVHNAAAFWHEDKFEKSALSAMQALEYATPSQKAVLNDFLETSGVAPQVLQPWNYAYLQKIQLRIPFAFAAILATLGIVLSTSLYQGGFEKVGNVVSSYYQKVRFNSGAETVDDLVVGKIFNVPVDLLDTQMLYHLTSAQKIMYGPSEKFDILSQGTRGQTVRVTGYTPDEIWYRVMLDNGEMGFIKKEHLKKGVFNEIPKDSKIYQKINGPM